MRLLFYILISLCTPRCSFKHSVNDNDKLNCLNRYIKEVSVLPVYSEVRLGLLDSITKWKAQNLEMKWYKSPFDILDSAVFYNKDFSRCIFLLIQKSPPDEQYKWNFVQTLGGEKINNKWQYYHVSFPTLSYSLKSNGYKDLSNEYLSRDARLDIINRGFFKSGTCEIDSSFVDSEEWFADWIRRKHKLFLEGR